MHNAELTDEYLRGITALDGDTADRRRAAAYMRGSTAIVHGEVVACSFLPRLFDADTYRLFDEAATTIYRILSKVMQRFLDDEGYRALFSFDPRLVDLILIPRRYDCPLPVARVDLFLNEETGEYGFCEFNTDGTSGMNENREITTSIRDSASYRAFATAHDLQECELFDSWIDEFLAIYATFENAVETPRIAICDFLEHATLHEFEIYRQRFLARGVPCSIVDVRDFRFDGEVLRDEQGNAIDAVWRRCIYKDVLDNWEASQPMVEAARAGKTALIGSFLGTVAHDKRIFSILHDPATKTFLSEEENTFITAHIPHTTYLNAHSIDLDEVIADKDDWVIKPTDDNGASDVFAGVMCTADEWRALIERFANGASGRPFLAQRFITPYPTKMMPPDTEERLSAPASGPLAVEALPYNNMSGLYLYNGIFAGVFSRLGPQPVICGPQEGLTAATIWVDAAKEMQA